MFRFLLLLFVSLIFILNCNYHPATAASNALQTYTIYFDQIKFHNGTALAGYYNFTTLRIAKFNRSTFVFNYEGELQTDYDETFSIEAEIFSSRLNNNQFSKTPASIPKMTVCDAVNRYYKVYGMKEIKDYSNLPQFEPGDKSCTFKKVKEKSKLIKSLNKKLFFFLFVLFVYQRANIT